MSDCIFCRIAMGEIPATVVARDAYALAFRDLNPQAPTHLLVIPLVHRDSAADADPVVLGQVMALATQVARDLALEESGYRLVTNIGPDGGQSVGHFHVHVLGGRAMGWPPG
jgi:histidine triad (HIT) family protein